MSLPAQVTFKAISNNGYKSPGSTPSPTSLSEAPKFTSSVTTPASVEGNEKDSPKSVYTLDSGLGSSTEGEKFKGYPHCSASSKAPGDPQDTDSSSVDRPSNGSGKAEESLNKSFVDESDKWLREKKNMMGKASKLQTGTNLKIKTKFVATNTSLTEGKVGGTSPIQSSQSHKNNSDSSPESHISYGSARQKFAVFERTRIGYQSARFSLPPTFESNKSKLSKSSSDPDKRCSDDMSVAYTKVTAIRPTSLIKAPILVTPVSNETVEISRPLYKKLEYTEEKEDSPCPDSVRHRKNSAEDVLMVSSLEVQVKDDISSPQSPSDNSRYDIEFSKKLNHKTGYQNVLESPSTELPALKSNSVCPPVKRVPVSPSSGKVFSPGSESSFEVLDSPSDSQDLTDQSPCDTVVCNAPSNVETSISDPSEKSILQPSALVKELTRPTSFPSSSPCDIFRPASDNNPIPSSIGNSSLVESLTRSVMTESLESLKVKTPETSSLQCITTNPSDYYSFTATSNNSLNNSITTSKDYILSPISTDLIVVNSLRNSSTAVTVDNNLNNTQTDGKINSDTAVVNNNNVLNNLNSAQENKTTTEVTDENFNSPNLSTQTDFNSCIKNINRMTSSPNDDLDSTLPDDRTANIKSLPVATDTSAVPPFATSSNNATSMCTSSVLSDSSATELLTPTALRRSLSSNNNNSKDLLNTSYCSSTNVASTSADMDQDFLIDDEISDQPDLTFGGEEMGRPDSADSNLQSDIFYGGEGIMSFFGLGGVTKSLLSEEINAKDERVSASPFGQEGDILASTCRTSAELGTVH